MHRDNDALAGQARASQMETVGIFPIHFDNAKEVRSLIDEKTGEVWIHAADWWEGLLGMANVHEALKWLKDERKRRTQFPDSIGRTQEQWFIDERAAVKMAFRSNHPQADEFTDRIADIVVRLRKGELQLTVNQLAIHWNNRPIQVQNVKDVAARIWAEGQRNSQPIIEYHSKVFKDHSPNGMTTTQAKSLATKLGLSSRTRRSAREVAREIFPIAAAKMSVHDFLVANGYEYDKVKEVAEVSGKVFETMHRHGIGIEKLQAI